MNMISLLGISLDLTPMDKTNVLKSLEIMWKGVLAIFITIAIILFVSWGINTICNKARAAVEKKRAEQQANKEDGSGENKAE